MLQASNGKSKRERFGQADLVTTFESINARMGEGKRNFCHWGVKVQSGADSFKMCGTDFNAVAVKLASHPAIETKNSVEKTCSFDEDLVCRCFVTCHHSNQIGLQELAWVVPQVVVNVQELDWPQ